MVQSESDSEEEVLFESTKKSRKPNGFYARTGNGFLKNGKHNAWKYYIYYVIDNLQRLNYVTF